MPKLLYQGHGSFRIVADDGAVVYVDPFMGEGYDRPADIILVTHQHSDHNQLNLITKNENCAVITEHESLAGIGRNTFDINSVIIEAVEANNQNHPPDKCVGYIVILDGVKIYFSGDTSKTKQMADFKTKNIDYAFLCCDGHYNMGLEEAAECAELIGARHNIPVHMKPGALFDRETAERFTGPNRLIVADGEEIELK